MPYIKDCFLGTVETPCTTALSMEEDYFLMLFWGTFISFSIIANTVVFFRTCALPTCVPPDTAVVERAEAYFSNSRTAVSIWTFAEHTSMAMGHQLILHTLKGFWEYWSFMVFHFTRVNLDLIVSFKFMTKIKWFKLFYFSFWKTYSLFCTFFQLNWNNFLERVIWSQTFNLLSFFGLSN